MPDLGPDFDRIEGRMLQTFGISQTLLTGANSGETYAADALNRDLITQLMETYQSLLKRHYRARALIVAEAQEHYDYDERNGRRYVKMEEVLEADEETGDYKIVEQPKLLVPELVFPTLNLHDQDVERQFVEAIVQTGVPISMRTRLRTLRIDLDEEIETRQNEVVQLAVEEQQTRKRTYQALRDGGLPIPDDLSADFRPLALQAQQEGLAGTGDAPIPQFGQDQVPLPNLAPVPADEEEDEQAPGMIPMMTAVPGDGTEPDVPEESSEQRAGMPSAAVLFRRSARVRALTPGAPRLRVTIGAEGERLVVDEDGIPLDLSLPVGHYAGPRHIGVRRHIVVDPAEPLPDDYAAPLTG
jgi:hypothetical protein